MQNTSKSDEALIIKLELPCVTVAAMLQWLRDHVDDVAVTIVGQKLYVVADKGTLKEIKDAFNQRFGMLSERYTLELK